jgi:hypothetical protein
MSTDSWSILSTPIGIPRILWRG